MGAKRIKKGDVILTHCNSAAAISVVFKCSPPKQGYYGFRNRNATKVSGTHYMQNSEKRRHRCDPRNR
ncbi:MAG: hypothetical protein ACTSV0_03955 [Candidatus Freyarchaeota archaeon]